MDAPTVENDLHDTVSVELPRRHKHIVFALLAALFAIFERYLAWSRAHPHDPATKMYYILFTAGVILIALISCWRALARYWVRVSPYELTFDATALGLHQTRRYPRSEVACLRVDEQRVFTYRPWLAFDRRGKRRFIGVELDQSKVDGLLDPIYSRFPEIAPGKLETKPTTD